MMIFRKASILSSFIKVELVMLLFVEPDSEQVRL